MEEITAMKKFGLIGGALSHSYSPLIHSKFGDYEYDLLETKEDELKERLHDPEYQGFNVTIPFKILAMELCDVVQKRRRRSAALIPWSVTRKGNCTDITRIISDFVICLRRMISGRMTGSASFSAAAAPPGQ